MATEQEVATQTLHVAVTALAALRHPDRIARFLAEWGVQGARNDGHRCVLANWLRAVSGMRSVYVDTEAVSYPGGQLNPLARSSGSSGGLMPVATRNSMKRSQMIAAWQRSTDDQVRKWNIMSQRNQSATSWSSTRKAGRIERVLCVLAARRDADQIAAFLQERGVAGISREPERCPLAVYLQRMTGIESIAVTYGETHDAKDLWVRVKHPRQVAKFLRNVDDGKYPELLLPTSVGQDVAENTVEVVG